MTRAPGTNDHVLSSRARRIGMSATLAVSDRAKKLRADGVDVLDFSVGEPDLPTPERVKRAGGRAIDDNKTRYTASSGILELREAIAAKLEKDNGLSYGPEAILVSPGAKASLYFAAMALFDEGDEVIIPSPYWVSYPEQVGLAGATPVIVPTMESEGYRLDPDRLRAAVTARTKGLFLNYPSNPTGACLDRENLAAIAAICVEHDVVVVADEIYEKMLYDGRAFVSIAGLSEEIQARTVVVNGMSKAFSMTGWRMGYAAGPYEIIKAMARIQSHSTSHATSISQWAALEALESAGPDVERMVAEFEGRRDVMHTRLAAIPGVSCFRPEGAFYMFPDVSGLLGRRSGDRALESSQDLSMFLLDEAAVAVVPGEGFGAPGHIRLSYAAPLDQIEDGMGRIERALASL
ncbi:MAG: pyridoxal phosphate-dependent aminotransferase [Acidobacteriota bacterium]|nr:pyridoxal phosphate-dependent aminotransferase [Acidobacteriota bacterium]